MPVHSPITPSFNAGIFSPLMAGHVNAPRRESAVAEMQNMIPTVQGPATRRGGTRFVFEQKDSTKRTALVEFEFSTDQAWIIEMGDLYMRFYKDNGILLEDTQVISAATQADPVVITYAGADNYANGDEVFVDSGGDMVEINQRSFIVASVDTGLNTFELTDREGADIDGTGYTAYTSGGTIGEVFEITTLYADADLFDADGHFEFRSTQSNDVLYITHENYAISALIRTTDTSWSVNKLTQIDGPYDAENTDATNTITPSATVGSITLTSNDDTFASTDVDRLIRIQDSASNWTWLLITAFTDSKNVTATVSGAAFADTTARPVWRLGLWAGTTANPYPSAVWLYQGRLVTATEDRLDFTQINGFTASSVDFTPTDPDGTVNADNAISIRLGSNRVNDIRWIADHEKALIAGTTAGEWVIRANTLGEAITPSDITANRATLRGSAPTQAVVAGSAVLFIQRARLKMHELGFNFEADGFRAPDMTLLADDVTLGGITQLAYQAQPQSIIWAVRADGVLLGFTYEREENVLGWHKHIIGGSFSTGDAVVEHVAAIPSSDTSRDELWLIVKRTINSVTRRYVEYMTPIYDSSIAQADAVHVDSSGVYAGAAATVVRGLDHLEGETVAIYNEGKSQPTAVVSGGAITIPNEITTTKAQVGLANTWKLETLPIVVGGPANTFQGKPKRIDRVIIRYLNTLGVDISGDGITYDSEEFNNFINFGLATALFTDDVEHRWPGDYDRKGKIYLKHDGVFPATIQAIMPRVVTSDR